MVPPVIGASSTVPFTLTRGASGRVDAVRPSGDRVSRTVSRVPHALGPAPASVVVRALNADPAGRPADGAALLALVARLPPAPLPGSPAPNASSVGEEITRGWRTLAL
ncbi:hypothetical protein [Kitasatospora sp. NPDC059817]|uniref:hypothetical protein n=1 Tax=Kitasatospora sp. NPDC059817 TaxID=3346961 RepID=UPI00364F431D